MANAPRNLTSVTCPKVLMLADTHWQNERRPIRTIVEYVQAESFDHVVLLYDRHHAHWLREAGVENVHFFPGFEARSPTTRFVTERRRQVAFAGAIRADKHLRRQRLVALIRESGLPLREIPETRIHSRSHFGHSLVTCQTSLNGELSVDVFEALGAGALLLTDRLSVESGQQQLFEDGKHIVCYDSPKDLVEKAGYYLSHPDEAIDIARQGHEHYLHYLAPEHRVAEMIEMVFRGTTPQFDCGPDPRYDGWLATNGNQLKERADLYDLFQVAQAEHEEVNVLIVGSCPRVVDLLDLPRVKLHLLDAAGDDDGSPGWPSQILANRLRVVPPTEARNIAWNAVIADLELSTMDIGAIAQTYAAAIVVLSGGVRELAQVAGDSLASMGYHQAGQLPVFFRSVGRSGRAAWRWS